MITDTEQLAGRKLDSPLQALRNAKEIFEAMSEVEHPLHRDVRRFSKQDWLDLASEYEAIIKANKGHLL